MARRGRDEIGKAGFWSDTSASLDVSVLKTTLPSEDVKRGEPSNFVTSPPGAGVFDNDEPVRPHIAPPLSSVTSDEVGGVDDEDDAAHEFEEALVSGRVPPIWRHRDTTYPTVVVLSWGSVTETTEYLDNCI